MGMTHPGSGLCSDPARADICTALASLGSVDSNGMIPASIRPGKTSAPDAIHDLIFEYPYQQRAPFGDENSRRRLPLERRPGSQGRRTRDDTGGLTRP